MKVYCKLKSERTEVLNIVTKLGYGTAFGTLKPNDVVWKIPVSGRVTFSLDEKSKLITISGERAAGSVTADAFTKLYKSVLFEIPESYPFDLIGDPVEIRIGEWYRQVSNAFGFVLDKPVQCIFQGGGVGTFGLIACIKNREKPFIGSPNGSTNGKLFVRVHAPKKVVKLTQAQLQLLITKEYGSNAVLQIVT